MATANFASAKLRALLAILGVLVGTASVVALVSSGYLATEQALAQVSALGVNILSVSIYDTESDETSKAKNKLSIATAMNMAKISSMIRKVAPYTSFYNAVSYEGHVINASLVGVTSELKEAVNIGLEAGRFIHLLDNYALYCVIGNKIYNNLLEITNVNPLGKQILVGDFVFTIIGIAKPWLQNSFFEQDIDNTIIVPIQTSFMVSSETEIRNMVVLLQPNANVEAVQNQITTYINEEASGKKTSFRSAEQIVNSIKNQRSILTLLLGLIGAVSLFVGGIGIMNIMLVTVIERKREIGIRRALGARQIDIQLMFLTEAIILSIAGGFGGVVLGIAVSFFIALFAGWQFTIFIFAPIVGFIVSVLVGVFFGFYPAFQAARLDPIEMLRAD